MTTSIYGTLVSIFGVGVLLIGESGVGKSELALGLLDRGHQLVADDAIDVKLLTNGQLLGTCPPLLLGLLEIRDLGIIDVREHFSNALLPAHDIKLVIALSQNNPAQRFPIEHDHKTILSTPLPLWKLTIGSNRNLPLLVERIVYKQLQKWKGKDSDAQFIMRQSNYLLNVNDSHEECQ